MKTFKRISALLLALLLAASFSITALAENNITEDNDERDIGSNEVVDTNTGFIYDNNGTIKENLNNGTSVPVYTGIDGYKDQPAGTVDVNNGTVTTNHGQVSYNYGNVTTNAAADEANNKPVAGSVFFNLAGGTVQTNDGTVVHNSPADGDKSAGVVGINNGSVGDPNDSYSGNGGLVTTNNGTITTNKNGGTVTTNNGTITDNYGTVSNNAAADPENNLPAGTIVTNQAGGVVDVNNGTIVTNAAPTTENPNGGQVNTNNGTITENKGTVETNAKNGTVETNKNHIGINNGKVETNDNNGDINFNNGTVSENNSTIPFNTGTVNNGNSGRVNDNLGGEVTGKPPERNYFGVTVIFDEDGMGTHSGEGFFSLDKVAGIYGASSIDVVAPGTSEAMKDRYIVQDTDNDGTEDLTDAPAVVTVTAEANTKLEMPTVNGTFNAETPGFNIDGDSSCWKISFTKFIGNLKINIKKDTSPDPDPPTPTPDPKPDPKPSSPMFVTTYKLKFDLDGGVMPDGKTELELKCSAGQKITLPEAPTKEGFTFAGWETTVRGKTVVLEAGAKFTVTAGKSFVALWEEN